MEKLTEITFQRWIKWAKIIDSDLKQIIYKYDVHRQFIDVVNANIDHINQNNGSTYINFVSFCYYDSLFSGIRRHAKYKRKEGVSLLRLIDNIYKSSNQFTFDYYLEQYPYKYNIPHWQKDVFSSFSSGGDTIDNNVIDNDLSKLEHISKNITNFVDTHVAHLDPSSKLNPVSIKDVRDVIELFEHTALRYIKLILGESRKSIINVNLTKLGNILKVPLDIRKS